MPKQPVLNLEESMADFNITVNPDTLPNLLTEGGVGLKKLLESLLNQVLEAQMTEHYGAPPR